MLLFNKYDKETLKKQLEAETFNRVTFSFYRYGSIVNTAVYRDQLYSTCTELGVLGRVYVASEGINAQISIPEHNFDTFRKLVDQDEFLKEVPFKIAVEDNGKSFYKLIVRLKQKIVADGLDDNTFNVADVGRHLNAREFNEAMNDEKTIVIDMRNHYESEVGRFKGALCPEADTFREALDMGLKMVEDRKDHKILLYCTGGIRCEKASAWFRHHGFSDVNQLHGGIIDYARQIKAEGLQPRFIGKNFVFDDRLGERITDEVISICHQCGTTCDEHTNCANDDCHLLFIQCEKCRQEMSGCCTELCKEIAALPLEKQVELRRNRIKTDTLSVYRSRLRPDLKKITALERKK